jgi:hypothetical protein
MGLSTLNVVASAAATHHRYGAHGGEQILDRVFRRRVASLAKAAPRSRPCDPSRVSLAL